MRYLTGFQLNESSKFGSWRPWKFYHKRRRGFSGMHVYNSNKF